MGKGGRCVTELDHVKIHSHATTFTDTNVHLTPSRVDLDKYWSRTGGRERGREGEAEGEGEGEGEREREGGREGERERE